jgi:internalin A
MNWINRRIREAGEKQLPELDLRGPTVFRGETPQSDVFTELPTEILELTHLVRLNLTGHAIRALPRDIRRLEKLEELTLDRNEGIVLPQELADLSRLRVLGLQSVGDQDWETLHLPPNVSDLNLSFNELTAIPKAVTKLEFLGTLGLVGSRFKKFPRELYLSHNLDSLTISCNRFERGDVSKLDRLHTLRTLLLDGVFAPGVMEEISQLHSIQDLQVWSTEFPNIPRGWLGLPQLTSLEVYTNLQGLHRNQEKLVTIGNLSELRNVTSLVKLAFGGVAVARKNLRAISELPNLESLNLWESNLNHFPHEIFTIKKLKHLSLRSCGIREIPHRIGDLGDLTALELYDNPIKSIPEELGHLHKLTSISLSGTEIVDVPLSLSQLTNLKSISLGEAKLRSWPDVITGIGSLEYVDLARTGIRELPRSIGGMSNLETLNVRGNPIREIPSEVALLPGLKRLQIDTQHIVEPPPEIVARGTAAIQGYFEALLDQETEQLFEAKLIIVGEGEVGKTCLARKLIDPEFDIASPSNQIATTLGVEIRDWRLSTGHTNDFKINLWDFGGQEIYHATHQFFLTKRSLYLFVWDARKEDRLGGFDYWLNVVKLLSASSPIIIVLNKADIRIREIDQASLQRKFPNIVRFHQVSALTGNGLTALVECIRNTVAVLPHVGDTWPGSWSRIRHLLEADRRDYIDYEEFLRICRDQGLDRTQADLLSSYLHDLGVILHFQDDLLLQRIVILRPDWGTNAVYAVLDTREVQQNTGRFSFGDLDSIWNHKAYPPARHPELLQLMMRFELCFQLGDSRDYIIPELLAANPVHYAWKEQDNLRFEYQYDFMPAGIITRFIARNHDRIEKNNYWRYGVILTWEGSHALVVSDPRNQRIQIAVQGEDKKGLLQIVRREFAYIHGTLNNPDVKQMVPCICPMCRDSVPSFFSYDVLRRYREKNVKGIRCERSLEVVAVDLLLTGVYATHEIEAEWVPAAPSSGEGGRVYYVQHYHEGKGDAMASQDEVSKPARSPWASGGFYLVAFLAVISGLGALGNWLSGWVFPLVMVGGLLTLSVIGALQLKHDERLSEEGFLKLMAIALKSLPLLRKLGKPSNDTGGTLPPSG